MADKNEKQGNQDQNRVDNAVALVTIRAPLKQAVPTSEDIIKVRIRPDREMAVTVVSGQPW